MSDEEWPELATQTQDFTELPFTQDDLPITTTIVHAPEGGIRPWAMFRFWTSNSIYLIDPEFTCFRVTDLDENEKPSSLEGARFVGGELRSADTLEVGYPLPVPGMSAIFEKDGRHVSTSKIERVEVRWCVTTLRLGPDESPDWDTLVGRTMLGR